MAKYQRLILPFLTDKGADIFMRISFMSLTITAEHIISPLECTIPNKTVRKYRYPGHNYASETNHALHSAAAFWHIAYAVNLTFCDLKARFPGTILILHFFPCSYIGSHLENHRINAHIYKEHNCISQSSYNMRKCASVR